MMPDKCNTISVNTPIGILRACVGMDTENYPEIFVYLCTPNGCEIDLTAVTVGKPDCVVRAYIYGDTERDDYTQVHEWDSAAINSILKQDIGVEQGGDPKSNSDSEGWRVCSECGKHMSEGYCIEDGLAYYCSRGCLFRNYSADEYQDLYDCGYAYWTEWYDE